VITVPRRAPDSANSVVVLEVEGPFLVNPARLLSNTQMNQLRTFDAELHGSGLRFGDGKSFRAYVFDWKNLSEWVGWQTRLNQSTEFEVTAKYATGSKDNVGSFEVSLGDQKLKATVQPTANENESRVVTLGRVTLRPGNQEIAVRPVEIKGGELMRLFYVSLKPIPGKRVPAYPIR
jgi:hypothetical protein